MMVCHVKPEQFFNLIFGYNDIYLEEGSDLTAPAGTATKNGVTVPAREIWVVTHSWLFNATRGSVVLIMAVYTGVAEMRLNYGTPAAYTGLFWDGLVVMKEGHNMRWVFGNTVLNDDLYWGAIGYKVKLSQ